MRFVASPAIRVRLAEFATAPLIATPGEFGKLIAEEAEKRGKVVQPSGPKPD
jgi:hypothetical protein